ncbi:snRNA-activating protein complex subunit 1-like [Chrysoperla carnea]|uniref:snRNA-activating protein complex subunit 1-like n=1 Tax=Chrysoperla carnea TaxID=189513 RepID=UPI001D06230A|nr:snRNA-activating protein complex subunit 1-like [Chrysoperla carnea]
MESFTGNCTKKMVARYEAHKSSGYCAKGFKKDAVTLLELFYNMKTLKYQDFCEIWKKMHFIYIYCGRNIKSEVKEFTEEVLHTAKELAININNEFSKRVGALYLLYGLYFLQPVDTSCKIRMTPENFNIYLNLIDQLRICKQLDALYIGCKLIVSRSFYFVVTPHNYGLHRSFRKYHDQTINILNVDTFSLATQTESITVKNGLVDALNQLNEKYYQTKCVLPGAVNMEPEASLKLVDPNIGSKLLANLEQMSTLDSEPSTSQLSEQSDLEDDDEFEEKNVKTNVKINKTLLSKRRKLIKRAFTAKADRKIIQRSKRSKLKGRKKKEV